MILLFLYFLVSSVFAFELAFQKINALSRPFSSRVFPSSDGYMRVARPVSWTDCSHPDSLFKLEMLELSPDPPQRSSPLQVHVKGYLERTLHAGWLNYTASFGGLQLVKGVEDGCALLARAGAEEGGKDLPQCPIEAGDIEVTYTAHLPWHIPPGRYLIDVSVETKEHEQVICLKLDVAVDLIRQSSEKSD